MQAESRLRRSKQNCLESLVQVRDAAATSLLAPRRGLASAECKPGKAPKNVDYVGETGKDWRSCIAVECAPFVMEPADIRGDVALLPFRSCMCTSVLTGACATAGLDASRQTLLFFAASPDARRDIGQVHCPCP